MKEFDVIIIGKGPAGLSAALYTIRANLKTLILGTNESVLVKADKIENYYGFAEPVSGSYLLEQGILQVQRIGGVLCDEEVIGIKNDGTEFTVITTGDEYKSKAALIATGQPVSRTGISNLKSYEGKGVSYCTTCDGFFYRNKKVGILGFKDFAIHEAKELEPFTSDITLYTNGESLDVSERVREDLVKYKVNTEKIKKVVGEEMVQGLRFQDDNEEGIDGLFVAYDSASSINFSLKLGVITEGNSISVNSKQETNIPGLYAAGDCTGVFKQISIAVGQGAMAGRQIIEYIRSNK